MTDMNITSAQYVDDDNGNHKLIEAAIDGDSLSVPLAPGNRHYDEIMKQVAAGELTIQAAD
tara:strand:+ start:1011 stop:1193 length:183 start_codon:yes stop_codon:yes gene_type:complete